MPRLGDGYSTTIVLGTTGSVTAVLFLFETTVTPVGWEGGGAIPITTMRNIGLRTMHPKSLVTLSEMNFNSSYDPKAYAQIYSFAIQVNQLVTINFPDGSTFAFFGFLDEFKPGEHSEGNEPIAACKIIPTLHNGVTGVNAFGFIFTSIGSIIQPVYTV